LAIDKLRKGHHMRRSEFLQKSTLLMWIAAATGLLGLVDYATGYELNFFLFYFIGPITVAAYELGLTAAVIVSLLCATAWAVADVFAGHTYSSSFVAVSNTIVRLAAFLSLGWVVARSRTLLSRERLLSEKLQKTLAEVKQLEGLLPICANCKKIHTDKGTWQQMEAYIEKHTGSQFTHGLCPECARNLLAGVGLSYDDPEK
jgi:glucose-6-phosphate-specific signal transduction histidine kinase